MMAALTEAERRVGEWIADERAATLGLIEALVNTDSGSLDKAGVDAAGERIRGFLAARGIACDVVRNDRYGDGIRATVGDGDGRPILLMGHRDTVYARGEAARRPFRVTDGRGSGPGCCDMKAGLAMNAIVLSAFKTFGPPGPLVALFTADEEIGSPSSRALIEQEARRARAVFNAEPGRPNGGGGTARQGRACGQQPRRRGERDRGDGAQDRRSAPADRSRARDRLQCRHGGGRRGREEG